MDDTQYLIPMVDAGQNAPAGLKRPESRIYRLPVTHAWRRSFRLAEVQSLATADVVQVAPLLLSDGLQTQRANISCAP